MPNESKRDSASEIFVRDFCNSFFSSKRESSNATKSDLKFFKEHIDIFDINYKSPKVNRLYNEVKGYCLDYCQIEITKGGHPFSFMEDDFENNYCENILDNVKNRLFRQHCLEKGLKYQDELKKYNFDNIPKIIRDCVSCICAYSQEFDIISIYVQKFASSQSDIDDAKKTLSDVRKDVNQAVSDINDLNDDVKNAKTDLSNSIITANAEFKTGIAQQEKRSIESSITIVGIFVAVVTVLFGGISFINYGLDAIEAYSLKLFMLIGVIAIVLFDSILSLFYFMSKITGRTIVSDNQCWENCPERNCINCANCGECKQSIYRKFKNWFFRNVKRPICSVAKKSLFAFWVNVILSNGLLFLFTLYILVHNKTFGSSDIDFTNTAVSLILPVIILTTIFFLIRSCEKCTSNTNKENSSNNEVPYCYKEKKDEKEH